jgi:hypothetical protein
MFINASNVVLYLTNGISFASGNTITLNTNANVEFYSGGPIDTDIGYVNNLTQYAPAFKVFGLPNCASITLGVNPTLTMWLYAPEATLTFVGGGSQSYEVVGSIVCSNLVVNGRYNFHFDEVLGFTSPPWIIAQPTNRIVQVGSNATFAVGVAWTNGMSYQWYFNQPNAPGNTNISLSFTNALAGGTNESLTLTNVQLTDAGFYSVIVTNITGAVTSAPASSMVYTNATPTLSVLASDTNGSFQFNIAGVTGLNYIVQGSTNLTDWLSIGTNLSPFLFIDLYATNFPQRFYRAVFQP